MKLIKQSTEYWKQNPGLEGIYEHIYKCARVCYASKLRPGMSAKDFINDVLIKSEHGAMLEHGTVYLERHLKDPIKYNSVPDYQLARQEFETFANKYAKNEYSVVKTNQYQDSLFITTNYRVIVENSWEDDLSYLVEPSTFHEKRYSVSNIVPIGVSREFCRHRAMSFAERSTRYCNFSKDKFDNQISFVMPTWFDKKQLGEYDCKKLKEKLEKALTYSDYTKEEHAELVLMYACCNAEESYMSELDYGWQPQQARNVLPLSTATQLIITGTQRQWEAFFKLRCSSQAQPEAQFCAKHIKNILKNVDRDKCC